MSLSPPCAGRGCFLPGRLAATRLRGNVVRRDRPMTSTDEPGQIPRSIHLFERVQITALAVGWMNAAYSYNVGLRDKVNPLLFAAALIMLSVLAVLLIYRISRRRSSTAVWVLLAVSGLCAVPWGMLVRAFGVANWTGILLVLQGLLQIISLALLGTRDARMWIDER